MITFRNKPQIEDGYFGIDDDTFSDLDSNEEYDSENESENEFVKEEIESNNTTFDERIKLFRNVKYVVMNTGYGSRIIDSLKKYGELNTEFTILHSGLKLMAVFDDLWSKNKGLKNIYYIHDITNKERQMIKSLIKDPSDKNSLIIYRIDEDNYMGKYNMLGYYFRYFEKNSYCGFHTIENIITEYYSTKYKMYFFDIDCESG